MGNDDPIRLFPVGWDRNLRTMVFIDGENLALRYAWLRHERPSLPAPDHVLFKKDVFVWTRFLLNVCVTNNVIRKYCFTSMAGDNDKRIEAAFDLKELGIEAPMVFPKDKKKGSKQVDISLATEVMAQVVRKNINAIVLVAGDEDYVPLVEAVKREGAKVIVWFLENGLSWKLKMAADHYCDLQESFTSGSPLYE